MDHIVMGNVVRLKSGGPKMTIIGISDDQVNCIWFQQLESGFGREPVAQWFHADCLMEPPPGPGDEGRGRGTHRNLNAK